MAVFRLVSPEPMAPVNDHRRRRGSLTREVLVSNVLWFTQLRWIVVALLVVCEILAVTLGRDLPILGDYLERMRSAPLILALSLAGLNVGFRLHARRLAHVERPGAAAYANLWVQIISDLLILTAVVHLVGSVETFVAFAYMFHCVLACIFLSRRDSLLVVLLAAGLYSGCVALEGLGILPPAGLFSAAAGADPGVQRTPLYTAIQVSTAIATWMVGWYLTSQLAEDVRVREQALSLANERLMRASREKAEHMLRTTHELKAPFAAIDTSAQLLLRGTAGALSWSVRDVVEKIRARSRKLSTQILKMLQLVNLNADAGRSAPHKQLQLDAVLKRVIRAAEPAASAQRVTFDCAVAPVKITGVEDQIEMMLANLIANAHVYSKVGGEVGVRLRTEADNRAVLTITDHGIGIRAEKLPRIFEDYYHTTEAVRHNEMSTGLGLAIVRHVALAHDIELTVESEPDRGTTVTARFARP